MDINISLEQLMRKAKADSDLKARLIATENHKEPVEEFCNIATEVGCPIAMGELLALNETFCSNLLKSTNGGATYPIDLLFENELIKYIFILIKNFAFLKIFY